MVRHWSSAASQGFRLNTCTDCVSSRTPGSAESTPAFPRRLPQYSRNALEQSVGRSSGTWIAADYRRCPIAENAVTHASESLRHESALQRLQVFRVRLAIEWRSTEVHLILNIEVPARTASITLAGWKSRGALLRRVLVFESAAGILTLLYLPGPTTPEWSFAAKLVTAAVGATTATWVLRLRFELIGEVERPSILAYIRTALHTAAPVGGVLAGMLWHPACTPYLLLGCAAADSPKRHRAPPIPPRPRASGESCKQLGSHPPNPVLQSPWLPFPRQARPQPERQRRHRQSAPCQRHKILEPSSSKVRSGARHSRSAEARNQPRQHKVP